MSRSRKVDNVALRMTKKNGAVQTQLIYRGRGKRLNLLPVSWIDPKVKEHKAELVDEIQTVYNTRLRFPTEVHS